MFSKEKISTDDILGDNPANNKKMKIKKNQKKLVVNKIRETIFSIFPKENALARMPFKNKGK